MADPEAAITRGALQEIFSSPDGMPMASPPIVQCVQLKLLASSGEEQRYRGVFSDIQNFAQSLISTQLNHLIYSGDLRKGCFVRLRDYRANNVKEKKILIIQALDVLGEYGEQEKIGEPVAIDPAIQAAPKPKPTTMSSNNFYGAPSEQKYQPEQKYAPSRSAASHGNIYPIEALSPYAHKWTIKARVSNKSDVKTWHNKNGEGKLFSVNLLDESGEIKATGFNDQCDALFDVFQEGSVYYVSSPCRVQLAKKQFTNLNNDYELTFERDTLIEKAEEQDGVPQVRFNFVQIGDLQNVAKDSVVDTIGLLKEVAEVTQITSKTTSKPYDKRELTLVDQTNFQVRLTIWGNSASAFDVPLESVVAFRGLKVSDFGGRSLSLLSSGSMTVDPDIDEAHRLKGWYQARGLNEDFATHQNAAITAVGGAAGRQDQLKTITEVKDQGLGMSEEPDYFTVKATMIYIKQETVSYPACLSEGCNKKVVEENPGEWRCEKCNKVHPKPEYRYIMTVNVSDHTGQIYLSLFDEVGRQVMGMSADQLNEIRESGDDKKAKDAFDDANYQTFVFTCRAKMDNYQDQQRVRYSVLRAHQLSFASESAKLASLIKMYD